MAKRTILTVAGSAADTIPEIYAMIDPQVQVHFVRNMHDVQREAHAVILLGGTDINPEIYSEVPTHSQEPDLRRDWLEVALLQKARDQRLPVLGICRGHQMLAACYGGKLHQDLRKERVIVAPHGSRHDIEIRLPVLGEHLPTTVVNSYHHQAVSKVPSGFEIAATSLDGVIESIYAPGKLGVQWHPEMLWRSDSRWAHLFYWHLRGLRLSDRKPLPQKVLDRRKLSSFPPSINLRRRQVPNFDWLWGEGELRNTTTRKVQSWDPKEFYSEEDLA